MPSEAYPSEDADTKLVNLQHCSDDEVDAYIGRETEMYDFEESPHHNPYKVADYGRRSALAHYAAYFYERYLEDEDYREQVHALEGQTLACWCWPQHCHGEVIIDLLEARREGGFPAVIDHIEEEVDSLKPEELGMEGLRHRDAVHDLIEEAREGW